jgi:hypothetical protein
MGKLHIGEICTECGTKVARIMWGLPTEEGAAEAERKGWHIGGCCIDERVSRCDCGATSYNRDGHLIDAGVDR